MAEQGQTRGGGYGLSADVANKLAAKYDHNAEQLTAEWIERVTGETKQGSFGDWLHDGTVLCKLINTIQPDSVKKVEVSSMPFKQMINISNFLRAARSIGIAEFDAFETADLYEQKDLMAVIRCLSALSRAAKANVSSFHGPYLDINFAAPTGMKVEAAAANTGLAHDAAKRVAPSPSALKDKIDTMNIGERHHTSRKNPVVAMIHSSISGKSSAPAVTGPSAATTGSTVSSFSSTASSSSAAAPSAASTSGPSATASHGPVGTRGGGYGLSAECAMKQAAKYDPNAERLATEWIERVTGERRGDQSFAEWLKSGQVLCKLLNVIQSDTVKKVETSSMPFKQMTNISNFLRAARTFGIMESDMFETADLYDEKDLAAVVRCLHALSRAVQKKGTFRGPFLEITHAAPAGIEIPGAGAHTGLNR